MLGADHAAAPVELDVAVRGNFKAFANSALLEKGVDTETWKMCYIYIILQGKLTKQDNKCYLY